jgi:hypothetical protein
VKKNDLLKRIKEKAEQDKKLRRDPRFLETMGFLVAKGFLKTNYEVPLLPNKRLRINDVVWAGQNVEPRILEVLPAAVLRLEKHFDLNPTRHKELFHTVTQLRRREIEGKGFCNIAYEKIRIWADLPLKDRRIKPVAEKKLVRTFRFTPAVVDQLKAKAQIQECSETELLEKLVLGFTEK